jgi:hypothetical protein
LKIFSIVSDWLGRIRGMFGGSSQLVKTLGEVEQMAAQALPAVQWVGDVVVSAISNSHLPVSDIIAIELRKMCPDLPNIDNTAAKLASKDRADMLLSLAVLVLQYMGARSVKLSILRAAVEVAHLIYSAQKGK